MTEKPNACCNDPDNLEELQNNDHALVIVECRVCGCKHYEFTVDPGEVGMTGASL